MVCTLFNETVPWTIFHHFNITNTLSLLIPTIVPDTSLWPSKHIIPAPYYPPKGLDSRLLHVNLSCIFYFPDILIWPRIEFIQMTYWRNVSLCFSSGKDLQFSFESKTKYRLVKSQYKEMISRRPRIVWVTSYYLCFSYCVIHILQYCLSF